MVMPAIRLDLEAGDLDERTVVRIPERVVRSPVLDVQISRLARAGENEAGRLGGRVANRRESDAAVGEHVIVLAVGAMKDRLVPVMGGIATKPMMTITLSCDHRVLDGARGAMFLHDIVEGLQNPVF